MAKQRYRVNLGSPNGDDAGYGLGQLPKKDYSKKVTSKLMKQMYSDRLGKEGRKVWDSSPNPKDWEGVKPGYHPRVFQKALDTVINSTTEVNIKKLPKGVKYIPAGKENRKTIIAYPKLEGTYSQLNKLLLKPWKPNAKEKADEQKTSKILGGLNSDLFSNDPDPNDMKASKYRLLKRDFKQSLYKVKTKGVKMPVETSNPNIIKKGK